MARLNTMRCTKRSDYYLRNRAATARLVACVECGTEIVPPAVLCVECAAGVLPVPFVARNCADCGAEAWPEDVACVECGVGLEVSL